MKAAVDPLVSHSVINVLLLSFPQNRFVHIQVTDVRIDAKLNSVLDRSILL